MIAAAGAFVPAQQCGNKKPESVYASRLFLRNSAGLCPTYFLNLMWK
jgi:hypothetical protein